MAAFAFSTTALPQGATFVFGLWICIVNGLGGFDSHLANPIKLETISSKSCDVMVGSDDHGDMLLPDFAKEIEQKLEDNSSSTRTQIDLKPNSTRIEIPLAQPVFGLCNTSLLTVPKCHFHPSTILNNKGKLHALLTYLCH